MIGTPGRMGSYIPPYTPSDIGGIFSTTSSSDTGLPDPNDPLFYPPAGSSSSIDPVVISLGNTLPTIADPNPSSGGSNIVGLINSIGTAASKVVSSFTGNYATPTTIITQPATAATTSSGSTLSLDKALAGGLNFIKQNLLLVLLGGGIYVALKHDPNKR